MDSAEKLHLDEAIPEINFIKQIVKYIQAPLKNAPSWTALSPAGQV